MSLGARCSRPRSLIDGRRAVRTPSGGAVEVVVSTLRISGCVFWTKRRLQPAGNRFAALVLLAEGDAPDVYLVPTTECCSASPPFTHRENVGKRASPSTGSHSLGRRFPRFSAE